MLKLLKRQNPLARFPRLDSVLMVEETIKKYDGEFRKKRLWEHLPKKMMYQTFSLILDYLIVSRKVSVDSEGKIGWIFYPEDVEKLLKKHIYYGEKMQSKIQFANEKIKDSFEKLKTTDKKLHKII